MISAFKVELFALYVLVVILSSTLSQIPTSSVNWKATATGTARFSGRNSHASCVFNGKIWVTGGRTVSYSMYNLVSAVKTADVWSSPDGVSWTQETELIGDFYAQNSDAMTPGDLAPWYTRFGHSLNVLTSAGYGIPNDLMILTGGYSPEPSNDVWITPNGKTWYFTGLAPWGPRAWHAATTYQGKLWLMGGSPLNNEVWRLDNISSIVRTQTPLTRAMYMPTSYALYWTQLQDAPWSPRVGAGLVSQWYTNSTSNAQSTERMVLAGGYGGWPMDSPMYTGMYCQSDVWAYNSTNWNLMTPTAAFGERAYMTLKVLHGVDPRTDPSSISSPKMFLFSGGNIGNSTLINKKYLSMVGMVDAYWSRDAITWYKINYNEGGAPSVLPLYSSQEWTKTIVNAVAVNLGMWGASMVVFNQTSKTESPGQFYLIGGGYVGSGPMSSAVFVSQSGILCDSQGTICNSQGTCVPFKGCQCTAGSGFTGDNCQIPPKTGNQTSSAIGGYNRKALWLFASLYSCHLLVSQML